MSKAMLLLVGTIGCLVARGDLHVRFCITDSEGSPITNAVVNARALAAYHMNAGLQDSDYRHYGAETDFQGQVDLEIVTRDTRMEWGVKAEGYYGTEWDELSFCGKRAGEKSAGFAKDSPKVVRVVMYRKKSPIPAYAFYAYKSIRTPRGVGEFGFDLKVGDWLQPIGKGCVADFNLVRQEIELVGRKGLYEFIRFDKGCGFRRYNKTSNKEFPTTYSAPTNAIYETELHYMKVKMNGEQKIGVQYSSPVSKDEFLVLRTRVRTDGKGEVISANYSKICGAVDVADCFEINQVVFNPTPNDANLEFDPMRNLNQKFMGCGLRP